MGQGTSVINRGSLVHPSALIEKNVRIGKGCRVWAFAQIRGRAVIGPGSMIGSAVYIDPGVRIGARCNIHNKALLYRNLEIGDDCFVGPGVCFTNDPLPRANRIRDIRGKKTTVKRGASIGALSCVLPDVTIGSYAVVGAGSVVTEDVPDFGLVYGSPARLRAFVSPQGARLRAVKIDGETVTLKDIKTRFNINVKRKIFDDIQS